MKSSAQKIQMAGFDDLFGASPAVDDGKHIQEIPLTELHPFKNHPFQVRTMKPCGKRQRVLPGTAFWSPALPDPGPRAAMKL